MRIIVQNEWRQTAIFTSIAFMLCSLFLSRALLSCSIGAFVLLTTAHTQFKQQLKEFVASPLLIGLSFLFFIPFLSGLWSDDTTVWLQVVTVKLPFLLLPIAFAGQWQLNGRQWNLLASIFLIAVAVGCVWSTWLYLLNSSSIIESYLRAKTLPTPLNDDHVRFSWVVVIAVVLSLRQSLEAIRTVTKFIYALLAVFFILYLHLLSARTGLLMLYVFLLFFIVFIIRRYSPRKIIPAILLLIIVVATCWLTFPTLQNRLRYNRYDFSFIQKGHINPGTSDANRAISLQAGWDILKNNPFGVGAGDLSTAVDQWYRQNHPGIADASKLYPSSEWLVYGNFMGWPAVLAFTIIIIIPIFTSVFRSRFYWFCLNVIAICAFILETSLEIQFGIFIYCFTLLWWWKWFRADPISQKI